MGNKTQRKVVFSTINIFAVDGTYQNVRTWHRVHYLAPVQDSVPSPVLTQSYVMSRAEQSSTSRSTDIE